MEVAVAGSAAVAVTGAIAASTDAAAGAGEPMSPTAWWSLLAALGGCDSAAAGPALAASVRSSVRAGITRAGAG